MTQSQGNNFFDASDIARYHSGEMSAEERHALEKAALDDPFLADAIEGYTFTSTPAQDIAAIKERLQEKTKRRNIIPFYAKTWMKVAAILVVVAGGVWLLLNTQNNSTNEIAVDQVNKNSVTETSTSPAQNANIDSTPNVQSGVDNSSSDQTSLSKPEASSNYVLPQEPKANYTITAPENYKSKNQSFKESATEQSNQNFSRSREQGKDLASGMNANAGNTRNLNEMNRNLPQATVQERLDRNQANANRVRSWSDSSAESNLATNNKIQVDSITHLNVVMTPQPQAPLNEVVVSKSVAKKENDMKTRMAGVIIDTLEPAEGWTNFDDYIAGNLKVPDELKLKPVSTGEVELSFDVNHKGEPINITVVKSLCTKCDEEAKRLLKEGPKWKWKKNSKGKVRIRF